MIDAIFQDDYLKMKHTLFGIKTRVCAFFASPDSTFPMSTVPMSLYFSTTGIIKGPSERRFNKGKLSINGIKAGPLKLKQFIKFNT